MNNATDIRILISEPHPLVRQMLTRMIQRLGYVPLIARPTSTADQLEDADVLVAELAAPLGVTLAQAARWADPPLPVVCASVAAPPAELAKLGVQPVGALVKPFSSLQLDAAIMRALAVRRAADGDCPRLHGRAA
jgi:DNA-binding response OmpR family regulator